MISKTKSTISTTKPKKLNANHAVRATIVHAKKAKVVKAASVNVVVDVVVARAVIAMAVRKAKMLLLVTTTLQIVQKAKATLKQSRLTAMSKAKPSQGPVVVAVAAEAVIATVKRL
jgi:hypothetical protein